MKLSIRIVDKEQFNLIYDGIQLLYNNNTTTSSSGGSNKENNKNKERMPSPFNSPINSPNIVLNRKNIAKHDNTTTTTTTGTTNNDINTTINNNNPKSTIVSRKRTTSYDSITSSNKDETTVKVIQTAIDPTSGLSYPSEGLKYRELEYAQTFAYFPDTQYIIDYHSCAKSQSPQIGKK